MIDSKGNPILPGMTGRITPKTDFDRSTDLIRDRIQVIKLNRIRVTVLHLGTDRHITIRPDDLTMDAVEPMSDHGIITHLVETIDGLIDPLYMDTPPGMPEFDKTYLDADDNRIITVVFKDGRSFLVSINPMQEG